MVDEDTVLGVVKSSRDGVLQSDVWKTLGIDSRKCSRLITSLENKGLVTRVWEKVGGTRTYRILYAGDEASYEMLMAGDLLAPCIGCSIECNPEACLPLGEWILEMIAQDESDD